MLRARFLHLNMPCPGLESNPDRPGVVSRTTHICQMGQSKIGCMLDEVCLNHMLLCGRTLSLGNFAFALQKLVDICHSYGVEHDVIYNPLKYVCIVF